MPPSWYRSVSAAADGELAVAIGRRPGTGVGRCQWLGSPESRPPRRWAREDGQAVLAGLAAWNPAWAGAHMLCMHECEVDDMAATGTVCVTFDFDAFSFKLASGLVSPGALSRGLSCETTTSRGPEMVLCGGDHHG